MLKQIGVFLEVGVAKKAVPLQNGQKRPDELTRIKPGEVRNPNGRPKGARSKLGEQFVADLQEAWELHGQSVITRVIADRPQDFLKVLANMLPKELTVNVNQVEEMTDDQLLARMRKLDDAIRPFIDAQRASADSAGDGTKTAH